MKKRNQTVELMAFKCACGKAAIKATVTRLSVGVMSATVEDQVIPCPACGSTDIKAARAAAEANKERK